MTNKQPDALRLATYIEEMANELALTHYTADMDEAAAELRRLHTENTALQQGYAAARLEIESLHAQLEAIGAGGVESLRTMADVLLDAEPQPPAAAPQQDTAGVTAGAAPDGWKLVPVEPAESMLSEVDEEVGGHCHSCTKWRASYDDCRRIYAAMLAAAPQPSKEQP